MGQRAPTPRHPQLPQRMLDDLPQDLLLAILSNLEISDIANLRRVCKAWDNFIDENESTVFRAAAVVGLDVPPWAKLLQDLPGLISPRSLARVSTWKELCQSVPDTRLTVLITPARCPANSDQEILEGDCTIYHHISHIHGKCKCPPVQNRRTGGTHHCHYLTWRAVRDQFELV